MNTMLVSKHLLWKDYRQLRPALIGCWAILAAILLMACVGQLLARNRDQFFSDAILLVLATPTLTAMAASGILIGHERQSRTWSWSSSLPIHWSSSLVSKTAVWLTSSVVMVATLYLLYAVLMQVCRWQGFTHDSRVGWITPNIIFSTVVVVPLLVYVCFSIAALLWNDTLTVFVLAAITVCVLFVFTVDPLPRLILGGSSTTKSDDQVQTLGIALQLLVLVLPAACGMVLVYHWRWTTGQLATVGWGPRLAEPVSRAQHRVLWQNVAWSGRAPSEFKMLLAHSLSMYLGTRLMVFTATTGLCGYISFHGGPNSGALIVCWAGAALLGITAFAGDQSQSAYKFLADRGVDWRKLLIARTIPPVALAMVPVLTVIAWESYRLQPLGAIAAVVIALATFGFGLLCSLCTRVALQSVCLAIGGLMLSTLASTSIHNFWEGTLGDILPLWLDVLLFVVEVIVLCAVIVTLLRRWLIYDRVNGAIYFAATLLLGIVPSHLLAVGLCFLTIPNVPWQGLTEDQIRLHSELPKVEVAPLLPLSMSGAFYSYDAARMGDVIQMGFATMEETAVHRVVDADGIDDPRSFSLRPDLDEELKRLASALDRLDPNAKVVAMNNSTLEANIDSSVWIAAYATLKLRDVDLARRAWKVNAQLLSLVDYEAYDSTRLVEKRVTSVLMRRYLSNADWDFLKTGGPLKELQPAPVARETWARRLRMNAAVDRQIVRKDPELALLAPVRWYEERSIAKTLTEQLHILAARATTTQPSSRLLRPSHFHPWLLLNDYESQLPRT